MKSRLPYQFLFVVLLLSNKVSAEITGMVRVVSDYVFEGISQSNGKPALQGYVEYAAENGFYLHTWGSNVDFAEDGDGIEIDFYLGYELELTEELTLDMGYVNYFYVADDNQLTDYQYAELYSNLTIQENTTIYLWLANDDAVGGRSNRIKISHAIPLSDDYNLNLAYHYWHSKQAIWDGDITEENAKTSYQNYLIGVSKDFNGILVDLSYSNSNLKYTQQAESQFVLTISHVFE